jgi:hypothetical protein
MVENAIKARAKIDNVILLRKVGTDIADFKAKRYIVTQCEIAGQDTGSADLRFRQVHSASRDLGKAHIACPIDPQISRSLKPYWPSKFLKLVQVAIRIGAVALPRSVIVCADIVSVGSCVGMTSGGFHGFDPSLKTQY